MFAHLITFLVACIKKGCVWEGKFSSLDADTSVEESGSELRCPMTTTLWQFLLEHMTWHVSFSPFPTITCIYEHHDITLSFTTKNGNGEIQVHTHFAVDASPELVEYTSALAKKLAQSFQNITEDVFSHVSIPECICLVNLDNEPDRHERVATSDDALSSM
jgi:hypothetical protein